MPPAEQAAAGRAATATRSEASAESTCRDRRTYRPAVDRPALSLTASAGDGRAVRMRKGVLDLRKAAAIMSDLIAGGNAMKPMDLLADTRRYLASAIKQLEAINAGAPIAEPVTREQAINIVTEQIGLFESVLRRYGGRENAR